MWIRWISRLGWRWTECNQGGLVSNQSELIWQLSDQSKSKGSARYPRYESFVTVKIVYLSARNELSGNFFCVQFLRSRLASVHGQGRPRVGFQLLPSASCNTPHWQRVSTLKNAYKQKMNNSSPTRKPSVAILFGPKANQQIQWNEMEIRSAELVPNGTYLYFSRNQL
jgi:hypothetical protein